ncbi:MAG: 4-hydroxyphenylacetate 3-hydroxylase N-terminal domain-containing protein [Alteraurantiacibacter sp.]
MKSGQKHIAGLRDGRAVFINGEQVADVTCHPAFARSVQSVGGLYDFAAAPENAELMTFRTPDGGRANRIWQLPESYAEMVQRRQALEAWSTLHAGFFGRAPDYIASSMSGMFMGLDVLEKCDPKRAAAFADYYRYIRENDLYLTSVFNNPQADRSKSASDQRDAFLTAGIVDEDAEGITVRGAKMLATGAITADEIFLSNVQPLQPGDERYAVSFAMPMGTKGLKLMSRKSYEQASPSIFDNPLGSRFDENDAVVYFDDVKVPWERVFVFKNLNMCQLQFQGTPAHAYQNYQAMIRLSVKVRFLVGIAHRMTEMNGALNFPQVRETLGQLAAESSMVDALVAAMEAKGSYHGRYFMPDRRTLYAAEILTQQLYPKILHTLRELAGGGMTMLPSSVADFANPEVAHLIERTLQSPAASATEKVKFYKLAWDAVGSEFASRHHQYEMFFTGAAFVIKGRAFRYFDWDAAGGLVRSILDSYDLADEVVMPG